MALAADPRNDSVLFAATPGGGVWKTEDGGESWNPRADSVPVLQACSIAIDRQNPDSVYVGTGDEYSRRPAQGVARSVDGGRTWLSTVRFTGQPVCTIAVDPTNSQRVFAGSAEGLFLSIDAGSSWNRVLPSHVTSIAFDAQGNVYAGTIGDDMPGGRENGLVRSSDGGTTWAGIPLPPNAGAPTNESDWVTVSVARDTLFVAISHRPVPPQGTDAAIPAPASELDVYRSTDGGLTWSSTFSIGQARPPMQLLSDTTGNVYLTGTTLFLSTNQGLTWNTMSTTSTDFHTVAFTRGGLLVGGEKGLASLALSAGTAAPFIVQPPIGQFLSVKFATTTSGFWAAGPAGLVRLVPTNIDRPVIRVPDTVPVGSVMVAGTSGNIFASSNRRILVSNDSGQTFSARDVIPDGELRAPFPPLALDPASNSTAYTGGRRIYRTTDDGDSWSRLGIVDPDPLNVVVALTVAPSSPTILYAATACLPEVTFTACPLFSRVFRSTSGGQRWAQVSLVEGLVNRLAVDPRQVNTIYAAIGAFPAGPSLIAGHVPGDLLLSTNGGGAWTSIRRNLPQVPVNTIVIDPTSLPGQLTQSAQRLFVGTDAGVFASFNAGLQWTDITGTGPGALPPSPVTDLAIRTDRTLLAATFGRGVYSIATAGLSPGIIVNKLSLELTLTTGATAATGIPVTNVSNANSFGWRLNALEPWITVPEPNGVLRPAGTAQIPIRISAVGLHAGTYLGRLEFISGTSAQKIQVTLHVTASPAQMTIISGNNATGPAGTRLPQLQVLLSDASLNPLPGLSVNFTIVTGDGSLSARTVVTNSAGIAATTLTLPANPGIVHVVASIGDLSVTFTLSAIPAPALSADSVIDAVTYNSYTSFGPGSLIAISGQNLQSGAPRVILATPTGEVELPVISSLSAQIKAMLPFDLIPGLYRIRVEIGAGRSNEIQIAVAPFAPAIFAVNERGRGPGIFIKEDGSVVTTANPADRGSLVTFYAAGLGAVDPPAEAGRAGAVVEPLNRTIRTPRVFFDIYQAEVIYSGLAPGVAGRYHVTVRVPEFVSPATNISVSMTMGGFASNRVTIPVR